MSFKESIIAKLWWFFKLEKRRYIVGILALSLVSVLNLIPPMVMGRVIDAITSGKLTNQILLLNLVYLLLAALGMYYLRYVWRMYILATSYRLGQIMRSRLFEHFTKMSPSFYQKYRTGDLMAHATNDINSLTRLAGGGVMSAVDASITALVTLITMFFSISWQMTLVAVLPLPFMAFATSRLGRKTHKAFGESQAAFSELNNKVQESVSGIKVTKSFGYHSLLYRRVSTRCHMSSSEMLVLQYPYVSKSYESFLLILSCVMYSSVSGTSGYFVIHFSCHVF